MIAGIELAGTRVIPGLSVDPGGRLMAVANVPIVKAANDET